MTLGGYGWSEIEEGVVGNKTEVVAWSNSGRINDGGDGFWPRFLKLETAAIPSVFNDNDSLGYDGQSSTFRLVPSLTGGVAEITTSVTLSHVWVYVPCF